MSTIHDLFSLVVNLKDEISSLRREVLDLKKIMVKSEKTELPLTEYFDKTAKIENTGLKPTLTSSETAGLLGISTSTVYRWRKARKIEGEMIGGTWFFHRRVILRFIEKNGTKPIKNKEKQVENLSFHSGVQTW